MKEARVYDWAGTLMDISGWEKYLKDNYPHLYHQYMVLGENDVDLKKRVRPRVIDIYNKAVEQALFPISLFSDVKSRLREDKNSGYVRTLFTSSPGDALLDQIKDIGLDGFIDEIILLDDIREAFQLEGRTKEDPRIFEALIQHIHNLGLTQLASYTDDTLKRVESCVEANRKSDGFQNIYLIKREVLPIHHQIPTPGYQVINNLVLVR